MTKVQRGFLILIIVIFVSTQVVGLLSLAVGFRTPSTTYYGATAYIVGVGFMASTWFLIIGLLLCSIPVVNWIMEGRDKNEKKRPTDATKESLRGQDASSNPSLHANVHEVSDDSLHVRLRRDK